MNLFIYLIVTYFSLELLNLIYYFKIKNSILKKTYYYGDRIEKSIIKEFFKKNDLEFFKRHIITDNNNQVDLEEIGLISMIRLLLSYLFNKSLSQSNYINLKTVYYSILKMKNKLKITLNNYKYNKNNDIFMRFGKNSINAYYKPLIITFISLAIRFFYEQILRYNNFENYYSSNTNVNYWYKINSKSEHTPIMFIHGFGIGIIPYLSYIINLSKSGTIICPVLPNISNVYFHPLKWNVRKNDFFPDLKLLYQEFNEILEIHKISKINMIAHSFGTFILSGLILNPAIRKKIIRKIFIDPVCFHSDRYKIYRSVDLMNEIKVNSYCSIIKQYLLYYIIYLDVYLKYATKRNLFSMDYLWGNYRYIDNNTLVVLSEKDEITPSLAIYNDMAKSSKKNNIVWLENATHGDLFMDNKWNNLLNNRINTFINK
jgi:hypothetical protein